LCKAVLLSTNATARAEPAARLEQSVQRLHRERGACHRGRARRPSGHYGEIAHYGGTIGVDRN
jgi:hypothetical protein